MQWILTVSEPFSLASLLRESEWLILPPYGRGRSRSQLSRVEHLSSGQTTLITISQVSAGVALHATHKLTSLDQAELSQRVWRMLRLGENLQAFVDRARGTLQLSGAEACGGRLLRGATLFEDAVKAVCLTRPAADSRSGIIGRVVDTYGAPLPSNPTRHAFPTPGQLHQNDGLEGHPDLDFELCQNLQRLGQAFDAYSGRLDSLIESKLPTRVLAMELRSLLQLTEAELDLVLLSLGRYDHIPSDFATLREIRYPQPVGVGVATQDTQRLYAPWQPWGGLAYWLWDWSLVAEPTSPDQP